MSEKRLPFPAITICSNGAINRDVVANAETFKSIVKHLKSCGFFIFI